ncbi:MAG TPA: zinc-ribbon domain-containing protein [Treponema sp.]|nr:zinc-ribbon domain-containing protein [Treponema sp.]
MKKRPKFFCEHCGTEVRQNSRVCTHCGRFFASVKCPNCGFTGDSHAFKDGCPTCGYAFPKDGENGSAPQKNKKKRKPNETDPLPWWIYVVSLGLLALVVALIIMNG